MDFAFVIATPFALAPIVYLLRGRLRCAQQGWLLAAAMAALFGLLLLRLPAVTEGGALTLSLPWMPQLGIALSLYIDGLALLFGLVVTGVGVAVMLYAGYYFEDPAQSGRFLALLLGFTGSMLGLVMAGNLLTLFVAWELTSLISFLLISFKGSDAEARSGASQALMITGGGGLALLVGLLLAGSAAGSFEFSGLLASGDLLRQHPWYVGIAVLVLLGCFSKSAQFPLHFWLPGAMAAPTPASAFLHSATMVKAGIYLLARFYPVLGKTPLWETALPVVGLATMLIGAALALRQRDLKGILAFSTVSQLGALVALIGLPGSAGIKAAMVGILAHSLYKGALFLVVGAVDHATGTRNIDELSGLRRWLPGFAAVTVVAGLSMAGVPPLFGFVAKETLLEAVIAQPLALAIVVLSATFTVTVALRLFWDVFMGPLRVGLPIEEHHDHDIHHPLGDDAHDYSPHHETPRWMVGGPALLAGLSVVAGLGIGPLVTPLVAPAVGKPVSLYLFPPDGLNLAFALSLTALAAGAAIFAARRLWLKWQMPGLVSGPQAYQALVRAVEAAGDLLLTTQNGKIRYYLAVILGSVLVMLATALFSLDFRQPEPVVITSAENVLKLILLALALGATLASVIFRQHLTAALALGVAGYAIGGLFLLEPAPDVALVQFLVETLATVLIVLILARTSEEERRRAMRRVWRQTRAGLWRDGLIAVAVGGAVMMFALAAVGNRPRPNSIAAWHLENALPRVGVNDVVAGIITDFRGTDTLIEIAVFSMAALGVLTMLARPNPGRVMNLFGRRPEAPANGQEQEAIREDSERPETIVYRSHFTAPVTQVAAALVLPIALLIAVAHILYAGAGPGDGFTAGVIAGLGVALWFVVYGYEEAKRRLRWLHPGPFIGAGLTVAIVNAALPLLAGRDFLSFTSVTGISLADIKLASSLLFEIGIFLAVFGGISAIMEAISHPKEVEPL